MAFLSLVLGVAIALAIAYFALGSSKDVGRPPKPPGPKGLPLVGNLNDLPPPGVVEAHHWLTHKELYGWSDAACFVALIVWSR